VELHAFDLVVAVTKAHDDAIIGFGGDGELPRQRFPFNDQRVVARGGERIGQLAENVLTVVMNLAGLAVEKFWGANDFSAKSGADGLVSETNTEDGEFSGEAFDEFDGDASFLRRARTRRNHNALGLAACNFLDGDFVVAMHFDGATKFAEILREVVGKRVVVVQQQNHRYFPGPLPRAAASKAVNKALDLLTLS